MPAILTHFQGDVLLWDGSSLLLIRLPGREEDSPVTSEQQIEISTGVEVIQV